MRWPKALDWMSFTWTMKTIGMRFSVIRRCVPPRSFQCERLMVVNLMPTNFSQDDNCGSLDKPMLDHQERRNGSATITNSYRGALTKTFSQVADYLRQSTEFD